MNCLCCGKPISGGTPASAADSTWHTSCIRSFFHTSALPQIDLTDSAFETLAEQSVHDGITVPGVQKKISLHLSREKKARLTIRNHPAGYILKPQTERYPRLPEAEHLVMQLADAAGIPTVPHALLQNASGAYMYITRRVDRDFSAQLYAMEDFCQLEGRPTRDKYRSSYERCARVIERFSSRPGLDLAELYFRLVFCFVTGNSDMHLKNFSLIETKPGNREFILSPAYDLLPVNLLLPEDKDETALTLHGKKRNLTANDFLSFAATCSLQEKTARLLMQKIVSLQGTFLDLCDASYLPPDLSGALKKLITGRMKVLASKSEV